jgi:PKHD-type hydroxylase
MFLTIANVVTKSVAKAMLDELSAQQFVSGKTTAGSHARAVKDNEQAPPVASEALLKRVERILLDHPVFKAAARPKHFVKLMASRYREGMHYGTHVDEPLMNGIRTDLSFTLFLVEPEKYEGGALIVDENDGTRDYKLAAGHLVLYPTTTLHRVDPVTSGARISIVGWVRSYIRDHADRELLFDLDNAIATLRASNTDRAVLDQLFKVRANLMRKWADD